MIALESWREDSAMTFCCDNCRTSGEDEQCPCVFAACEWCSMCVTHCRCAARLDDDFDIALTRWAKANPNAVESEPSPPAR